MYTHDESLAEHMSVFSRPRERIRLSEARIGKDETRKTETYGDRRKNRRTDTETDTETRV